jgi:hypothetical protein
MTATLGAEGKDEAEVTEGVEAKEEVEEMDEAMVGVEAVDAVEDALILPGEATREEQVVGVPIKWGTRLHC